MKKIIKITIVVIILLFVVQQLISRNSTRNTETPVYEVLDQIGNVEIRKYPALVMASTIMETDNYTKSSGNGFRTIASYIFGGNEDQSKISMTSPVMIEMSEPLKMSFVMPSAYSLNDLPLPNDHGVFLHNEHTKIVAVIQYSGFSNDLRYQEFKKELLNILEEHHITTIGPDMFFAYNPPYELTGRRNEVAIEVIWKN